MNDLEFAKRLTEFLLAGNSTGIIRLRQHVEGANKISVENSGHGIFIEFSIPGDSVKPFTQDLTFGDIAIQTNDMPDGGGVTLFVKSGYVNLIECYSFGDRWTDNYEGLEFNYIDEPRDLSSLDSAI